MTVRVENLCVDAHDPDAIARFWEAALGWERTFGDENEVALTSPGGLDLLFLRVPDGKSVKNRLHLDLRPDDQAAEVARLEGLGARRVDIGQSPDVSWVVMADPDGNEFCVLSAKVS